MTQEPLTLYKLIVLYMLEKVNFPLTKAQISDFILEKEYTTFLTLQQAISELIATGMVIATTVGNRTQLHITEEGESTLSFFENRISDGIKEDVKSYLKEKSIELRNEVSITSEYLFLWKIWHLPFVTTGRKKIRKSTNILQNSYFNLNYTIT